MGVTNGDYQDSETNAFSADEATDVDVTTRMESHQPADLNAKMLILETPKPLFKRTLVAETEAEKGDKQRVKHVVVQVLTLVIDEKG